MPLTEKTGVYGNANVAYILPPDVVDICQPCDVTVDPLVVTVGAVGFSEPPAHNAACVVIAAIVGTSFTVMATTLLLVVPQPFVAV